MLLPLRKHAKWNEKENCGVGFIAHIKGKSSHAITADALEMLTRMDHRGGCGCEANTGDGAGILLLPLRKHAKWNNLRHWLIF
jgi:glutamate synthase domain-containing protein 1